MKYLLIMLVFLSYGAFSESSSWSSSENCAHATQDIHTVSNSAYDRLLASLDPNNKSETEEKTNKQNPSSTGGQR